MRPLHIYGEAYPPQDFGRPIIIKYFNRSGSQGGNFPSENKDLAERKGLR
jgi:hypothetical protein